MELTIFNHFLEVRSITTDSRKIPANAIYFALKGDRFNGNLFAQQALEAGASMAVVDELIESNDERIVKVDNVLETLQRVALLYRRSLKIPFLAITGSNGKTTTKELVRDVLKKKYKVSATLGNLNNHIGIPLTILAIPADCEFAVIEMGANHREEISSYCTFTEPDFGLITNMGKAHLEGFGGEEGVVKGKKELYDYLHQHKGKIFVNVELEKLKRASNGMDIIPYGFTSGDFSLAISSEDPTIEYVCHFHSSSICVKTNLVGAYNLYNIASAVVIGRYFKIEDEKIHAAIEEYLPDNNRSQLTITASNRLIMDAYNANPTSLEFALEGLAKQKDEKKYFVIGDMLELGEASVDEHIRILEVVKSLNLKGILVGPIFSSIAQDFGYKCFKTNLEAKDFLEKNRLTDHLILIKGSRGIKLEEVIVAL